MFNKILGSDRSIVSNVAGTTRDAIDTVIERLDGILCGMKETSCPDQLATALKQAREKLAENA